jgi:DHA2 family multidrug resistance protein
VSCRAVHFRRRLYSLLYLLLDASNGSTLQSGTGDFFWPLIIRGIGMAILFVPLTTLAIHRLRGPEIGQGTGLNNMMRQLGGSFGIAIMTTIIHIKTGKTGTSCWRISTSITRPITTGQGRLSRISSRRVFRYWQARQMANQAWKGRIVRQTMLVTYITGCTC